MRATTTTLTILLAAATLGACNWTKFDDLADQAWANATSKPDVKSSIWGVSIQRGASAADSAGGGTLAVIGTGPGTYIELTYDESGSSHYSGTAFSLDAAGVTNLDAVPFLLASPSSSEVALVTTGNAGSVVVAQGEHTLLIRQQFVTNTTLLNSVMIRTTPTAATYMQPAEFPGLPGVPAPPGPLVAVGDVVLGTVIALPTEVKQPACKLSDGNNPIEINALAAVSAGATDDVLVWNGADGRLLRYPGRIYNGCEPADSPAPLFQPAVADKPAFFPSRGSQILTIDPTHVLLAGQSDPMKSKASFFQVFESTATSLKPVGNAVTIDGLRSAAILDVDGTKYAIAGYPAADVDTKSAGNVLVFKLGASGIDPTQVATLHDAQPEDKQSFGRAVTVMPYRGKNVIAVAADNEIFVYFQAKLEDGTPLYDETRQGK
jgi:hypothetical protein